MGSEAGARRRGPCTGGRPKAGGTDRADSDSTALWRDASRYATIATPMPEELSPSQAAARIGATTRSVQRWIASGRLPARRVGGRWRVASDAIDAFRDAGGARRRAATRARTRDANAVIVARSGPCSSPTAARSRRASRGPATASGSGRSSPRPMGRRRSISSTSRPSSARRAAGADALHPGFGFLAENAGLRRGGHRGRDPLGRPAARRDPGDGRQGRGPPARRVARRPGPARLRRRRTSRTTPSSRPRGSATRCSSSPRPAAAARGCAPSADPSASIDALAAARREATAAFGDDRLILERLVEGARHVEIQVLFDAHGHGRPPGRARLLDPAPPPEGPRGDAVAGGRRRAARAARRGRPHARPRGRLRERRHVRVPARWARPADLPRDEHAAPGRAPGHGAGHGARPRRRPAPDRGRRAAAMDAGGRRPAARPRRRGPPLRRGCRGRLPARRPGGSRRSAGRPATASGSMPGSSSGARSAAASTRCWPRSSPGAGPPGRVRTPRPRARRDRRPRPRHEPAVPALAGPPAGRPRRRGTDRHAGPDLAARRLEGRDGHPGRGLERCGRRARRAARRDRSVVGRLAAERRPVGPARGRRRDARVVVVAGAGPAGAPAAAIAVRAGDTVHLDLAGRSVAFRLAPAPDVDAAARAAVAHGVAGATGPADVLAPMPGAVLTVHVARRRRRSRPATRS